MAGNTIRILGIDTSLRSSGLGVVEANGSKLSSVEYGVVKVPAKALVSECLTRLRAGILELMDRTHPEAVAIEDAFFAKNARTALV